MSALQKAWGALPSAAALALVAGTASADGNTKRGLTDPVVTPPAVIVTEDGDFECRHNQRLTQNRAGHGVIMYNSQPGVFKATAVGGEKVQISYNGNKAVGINPSGSAAIDGSEALVFSGFDGAVVKVELASSYQSATITGLSGQQKFNKTDGTSFITGTVQGDFNVQAAGNNSTAVIAVAYPACVDLSTGDGSGAGKTPGVSDAPAPGGSTGLN